MEKKTRSVIILVLGALSTIAPFSIDMYLPGFPAIAANLHTTVDTVSYTLASFFAGVGLGQLICGPLLDRFGRKPPLLAGLFIYVLASVGCAFTKSIEMLIAFRFLQALGGSVGMVAPRAIVRDLFPVNENAKILSLLILVLSVSPLLAPSTGSFVIAISGWQAVFIVLSVVGVLMMGAVWAWLPESKAPDPSFVLRAAPIFKSYGTVMKTPAFYTYALAGGVSSAGLFAYISGSPFVFMEYFSLSQHTYGIIFACIAAGLISGSQLNSWLLSRYSSEEIMKTALMVQSGMGILMVVAVAFGLTNAISLVILLFLFLSCQGFCFPNSAALSMAPFTREAGSASALMGALQMALGALAAGAVGMLRPVSPLPMAGIMCACALCGLFIVLAGKQKIITC